MQEENKYDQFIQKIIKADKEVNISEVNNLENIYSGYLEREFYSDLLQLLKQGKFDDLPKDILPTDPSFIEYLEVYRFSDQNGQKYIATIYDSIELWQDPQIIDIFPFTN